VSAVLTACSKTTPTTTSSAQTAIALLRYTAVGTPDLTNLVGGSGLVTTDVNPSQNDIAFAVALQPDGKIIAVGNTVTTQASIVVIRYAADGKLDSTFGNGGITVTSLPSADAGAFAATLQADGKLLVAGRSSTSSGSSFLLLRYHTDNATGTPGTLDTAGFGAGKGFVTTAILSGTETSATSIALSGSDIVVAGHSKIGEKFAIVLARYTTSGALDTAFGSDGIVTTLIGAVDADVAALAVQVDGKIIAAGLAGDFASSIWDVALLRYNTDGALDLPFGDSHTGMVITDIGSSSNYANAVAIQGDGKIVVAGNAFADPFGSRTSDIAVLRYNTDGTLDTAGFGSGTGIVTTNVGGFDSGFAVAVQPGGKIVVAGNADEGVAERLVLLRYNGDGNLDSGFGAGGDGIVTRAASGPGTIASARALVLQPQPGGEIVVVGYD
jgi:uncharacterized delta-60 repeat protein